MKTVEFKVIGTTNNWAGSNHYFRYECSEPKDHSGTYVLASEAQERERVLVELLQSWEINTNHVTTKLSPSAQATKERTRAALAAKEG